MFTSGLVICPSCGGGFLLTALAYGRFHLLTFELVVVVVVIVDRLAEAAKWDARAHVRARPAHETGESGAGSW
jgi:hypothetical protein